MAGDSRVTDEMVERALEVWFEGPKEDWHRDDRLTAKWFRDMRRTLEAALSASPPAQVGVVVKVAVVMNPSGAWIAEGGSDVTPEYAMGCIGGSDFQPIAILTATIQPPVVAEIPASVSAAGER